MELLLTLDSWLASEPGQQSTDDGILIGLSHLVSLQAEGEGDEQSSTDQASAIKTKNVFIAQNVASLQELGKTLIVRKLVFLLSKTP